MVGDGQVDAVCHSDALFTFNDERGSLIVEGLFFARHNMDLGCVSVKLLWEKTKK
jgi:hypothetical protein